MSTLPKYGIRELTEILIKHNGLHEGIYALNLEFQFGFGMLGPAPDQTVPSAIVGLAGVSINRVETHTPNTVDASEVNPRPTVAKEGKPRSVRKQKD